MPWSFDEDGLKTRALRRFSTPALLPRIAGVVDCGAGAGLWRQHALTLPITEKPWTAIEIWGANIGRYRLRERYDEVRHKDFRQIKFSRMPGHLFIFGDVLEHLTAEDAVSVVRRAASVGSVIIVMPFLPTTSEIQEAVDGNEAERHLKVWEWEEWLQAIAPLVPEIVQVPPGEARNKGALIIRHPDHADPATEAMS